jgi:glycosyltransferase involved in cell wall biosynthesis
VPKVSVVIPCYNAHSYLQETLDSVRAQTVADIEIILVDDGSDNPDTLDFLASIGSDVTLIRKPNGGLSSARNAGFAAAKSPYVLPLDADDIIRPQMVEKCLDLFEREQDVDCVYTQIEVFGDEHGIVRKTLNPFEQLATNQLPYCMMLRRMFWAKVGGYDETMRSGYEDWEFNIRLIKFGCRMRAVDEPLFAYRRLLSGMLRSVSQKRHAQIWRYIRTKHKDLYNLSDLAQRWQRYGGRPSTHTVATVWFLLMGTAILPDWLFNRLFLLLRQFGKTARQTVRKRL